MALHIPKKIHQIWVGPNPVPPRHEGWIEGWKEQHPEWEHRLWGEEGLLNVLPDEALQFYHAAESYAGKADVARIWLVLELGGVYVDTDFQCLKPIDELLHGCRAFTAYSRYEAKVMNAIFGGVPHHPFVRALANELPSHFDPEVANKAGPLLFRDVLQGHSDVRRFERETFMPVTATDQYRLDIEDESYWAGAYAVHHFEGSWERPEQKHGLLGKDFGTRLQRTVKQWGNPLLHERPFHAYCVGMEQSGGEMLADIFSEAYRARHVSLYSSGLKRLALERTAGEIQDYAVRRILTSRDREQYLSLEANPLLAYFSDVLADLFPEAKFILPVSPPSEWLARTIRGHLETPEVRAPEGEMKAFLQHYYGPKTGYRSDFLADRGLHPLDGYLNAWRRHHETVLTSVPYDQLFVVRTENLADCTGYLTNWIGGVMQPPSTSKGTPNRSGDGAFLPEKIDKERAESRADHLCAGVLNELRRKSNIDTP
ncbi:hypothetical protein GGQ08_001403 [Salinibacter ruber]|uniref:glycosyltransferase n=1 Tax=Salinibacter ruber TaxID=146919 RepID=UPI001ABAF0C8|nr:glycosyltransferase [Salinibacter ruber]MCS3650109.1 hypothetical protein [Salinibacter ruber]MCS3653363.1 hypothetical protein [Salinibacter ruber]